jgi:hypothetical protein
MSKLIVRVAYISFSVFILFDKTHRDPSLAGLYCSGKHSRQSAMLFLQSSELGIPTPSPAGEGAPTPRFGGEGHSSWRERGWESPIPTKGNTLFIYKYFETQAKEPS